MNGARNPTGEGIPRSASIGSYAPSNLNSFSSPRSIFERSDILQALIDVFALVFIVLFLCATAISFPAALCILLFF